VTLDDYRRTPIEGLRACQDTAAAAMQSIAAKIGCTARASADPRKNAALADRERRKWLERENAELRRANEPGGARPQREVMPSFIDAHRD
jgi:hypothetical protein